MRIKKSLQKFFTKILFMFHLLVLFFARCWQATRIFRSYFFQCRFYPSCSDYFLEAIRLHGLFCGIGLTIRRLIKCHPLCEGGVDKVPLTTIEYHGL